jgi:hypothetical protein
VRTVAKMHLQDVYRRQSGSEGANALRYQPVQLPSRSVRLTPHPQIGRHESGPTVSC